MANFCGGCGAPLAPGTPFCGNCGTQVRAAATAPPPQAAQPAGPTAPPPSYAAPQVVNPQAVKKSSNAVKIIVAVVAVLFIGVALAIGGIFYAVHRVSQKAHEVSSRVLGEPSSASGTLGALLGGSASTPDSKSTLGPDPCHILSKSEVGHAIGIAIVDANALDGGCQYLAKGTAAEMAAKHTASLVGSKGADTQQQQMIEKISGGLFSSFQNETKDSTQDATGNVPVLAYSVETNSGGTEMHLNRRVLGGLGPGAQDLPGIGDEAFDIAGSMMMVRKRDKIVRIMYMSCPCTTDAIKPLAQKIADAL